MRPKIVNIHDAKFDRGSARGQDWQSLDLSGISIGVKVEVLAPGNTSSEPHYHTVEEEHVLVLSGNAVLHLGDEALPLKPGDHICFPAGDARAHQIENSSSEAFTFLVFGDRRNGDVVIYPERKEILVKALDGKRFGIE